MPRLSQASLKTVENAPLGPGAILANVEDRTIEGIRAILRKTAPAEETGVTLGAMTSVPTINMEPDMVNILEDVQGVNTVLRGAQQPQSYAITAEAEVVEVTPQNIHFLHPGLTETAWMNGATTPEEIGRTFRPKGFIDDADYIDNLVFCFESTNTDLFLVITLFNCLQTDAVAITGGEGGTASGLAATFAAHCGEDDFDVNTGTYLPPAEISWQEPPVLVGP
jgi:hypothetical protein